MRHGQWIRHTSSPSQPEKKIPPTRIGNRGKGRRNAQPLVLLAEAQQAIGTTCPASGGVNGVSRVCCLTEPGRCEQSERVCGVVDEAEATAACEGEAEERARLRDGRVVEPQIACGV